MSWSRLSGIKPCWARQPKDYSVPYVDCHPKGLSVPGRSRHPECRSGPERRKITHMLKARHRMQDTLPAGA